MEELAQLGLQLMILFWINKELFGIPAVINILEKLGN